MVYFLKEKYPEEADKLKEILAYDYGRETGFEISIDQFGELKSNMAIEKLNQFLDENVDDKKLIEREEHLEKEEAKSKKKKKSFSLKLCLVVLR